MTNTAERAGRWFRVSSGGQDEANQIPDVDKWIAAHEYVAAETYQLHGKSASKGRQDRELDRAVADMRAGRISVLVVWQSSRIERRGAYSVFDLARRVRDAGGRIEYVQDAYLNETNEMADVMLALAATKDRQKSLDISKQVRAAHDRIRANRALIGRPPFGYTSEGDEYDRRIVPTAEGSRYVPEAFQRVADGQTLDAVAAWLTDATGHTFHPRVVAAMIRRATYRGQRRDAAGDTVHPCPALVDGDLWRRANANLDARPSTRRGQRTDLVNGAALLSGLVFCGNPDCTAGPDSPMYKIASRRGQVTVDYLRCSGRGAQRKGCGAPMILMSAADQLMNDQMAGSLRPVLRPVFVPATGHQIEIDDVNQALRDLAAQGLDEASEDARRAELRAERARLASLPATPARTEYVPVVGDDGQPVTYGAKWAASDQAARRGWLKDAGFRVYVSKPGEVDADDDDDVAGEAFHRCEVYVNDAAAIVFRFAGDHDGLGAGLLGDDDLDLAA